MELIVTAALRESLLAGVTAWACRPCSFVLSHFGDQVARADSLIVLRIYSVEFRWHLPNAA
jgi:hypothetical protein